MTWEELENARRVLEPFAKQATESYADLEFFRVQLAMIALCAQIEQIRQLTRLANAAEKESNR